MKRKKVKNKERIFDDVINDIKEICDRSSLSQNDKLKAESLFLEFNDIRKFVKHNAKISLISTLVLGVLLLILVITAYQHVKLLENRLIYKSLIINKLVGDDDVLNQYKDYKITANDTLIQSTLKYIDGKLLRDSLHRVINSKAENITHLQDTNKIIVLQGRLDIVEIRYGIKFKNDFEVFAPKVDSALHLFPYFREFLSYNEKGKRWFIFLPENYEKSIKQAREFRRR